MAFTPVSGLVYPISGYFSIPVGDIEVGERLRPIDPVWAGALGGIMAADGQKQPILVRELPGVPSGTRWLLVAGGHRLEGCKLAGIALIKAIIVDADDVEARLQEVGENLQKLGLSPIDRAAHVAELIALKKVAAGVDPSRNPHAAAADVRWQKRLGQDAADATEIISGAYQWDEAVAEQVGFTSRTIRNDLALHRRLSPAAASLLRGHPITRNAAQLHALAKLPPEQQVEAATLLASGAAKGLSSIRNTFAQRPEPDPRAKKFNAVFSNFGKMGQAERAGVLDELAATYPRDFALLAQRMAAKGSAK